MHACAEAVGKSTCTNGSPVTIRWGRERCREGLRHGVIDEIVLSYIPVVLGDGERLYDGVPELRAELVAVALFSCGDSRGLPPRTGVGHHSEAVTR